MKFRPCIDIHNGKVKQIVGGSLKDEGDMAQTNFTSEQDAAWYAEKYKQDGSKEGISFCSIPEIPNILRQRKRRRSGAFGISGRDADRRRYHGGKCGRISGCRRQPCDRNLLYIS